LVRFFDNLVVAYTFLGPPCILQQECECYTKLFQNGTTYVIIKNMQLADRKR